MSAIRGLHYKFRNLFLIEQKEGAKLENLRSLGKLRSFARFSKFPTKNKAFPEEKALPKRKRYKELLLHIPLNILYFKV